MKTVIFTVLLLQRGILRPILGKPQALIHVEVHRKIGVDGECILCQSDIVNSLTLHVSRLYQLLNIKSTLTATEV